MTQPFLSIILPIYNEEQRLPMCLAHICDYLWHYTHWPFELICVLNGCTDRSDEICREFARNWIQIEILSLPVAGKGAAVRTGMLAATGRYRYMADVDLSTPITEIPRYLDAARAADLVCGTRQVKHKSLVRSAAHTIYSRMAGPYTSVHDPQCGFKLFRGDAAERIFSRVRSDGWGFDTEALYLAKLLGYRIAEISVPWEHDEGSKLNPVRAGVQMAIDLLKLRRLHPA